MNGYGLEGFAAGLNNGLTTGRNLYDLVQQDQLAKVRAQGIAEAQAAQAKATPTITDLGDQNSLTSNPQQSADPSYQPPPVNTSLTAALQHANDQQDMPDDARANGIQTYAVQQPSTQQDDNPDGLSSVPKASMVPDSSPAASAPDAAPADNLDANAQAGTVPLTPSKRFVVDGKGFDTQEDAAAYVKKQTPQLESFFHDTLVPKMTATLVAQGKIDQAQAWEKYADEEQTRQNMATWGKAIKLAQFGDYDTAATELMKLHPHFDDGYDLVSSKPTQGPDGSSGFTMTVKGPDGTTQDIYQDSKTITQLGLSQLSPIEMFNQKYKQQTNADIMAAKAGYDQQNDERTMNRALAVAGVQSGARQAVAQTQAQSREKVADTRTQAMSQVHAADQAARDARQQKALDAKAQQFAEQLKAQGAFRKGASPDEARRQLITKLAGDPMFNMKSPQDQQDQIDRTMKYLYPNGTPTNTQPATPAQQGISQPAIQAPGASPPAGKFGVPVFDPASGTIKTVYR